MYNRFTTTMYEWVVSTFQPYLNNHLTIDKIYDSMHVIMSAATVGEPWKR